MKKYLLPLFAVVPMVLTSCDAHFGSKHFDIPWWAVVLIIVIPVAAGIIISANVISKGEYKCRQCGKTFYPTKMQCVFSLHVGEERVFRCPHCGYKGFATKQ